MKDLILKYTSRKFILMLGAQIIGILVLFFPNVEVQANTVLEHLALASENIGALAMMTLTYMGYAKSQGAIDKVDAETKRVVAAESAKNGGGAA